MPIKLDDQVFVDLLLADDSVALAAVVGTVARYPSTEGGVKLPIENEGDFYQELRGVYQRIAKDIEVEDHTLRQLLLERWPLGIKFPIKESRDFVRAILLKVRIQMTSQIGVYRFPGADAAEERSAALEPGTDHPVGDGPLNGDVAPDHDIVLGQDGTTMYRIPPRR